MTLKLFCPQGYPPLPACPCMVRGSFQVGIYIFFSSMHLFYGCAKIVSGKHGACTIFTIDPRYLLASTCSKDSCMDEVYGAQSMHVVNRPAVHTSSLDSCERWQAVTRCQTWDSSMSWVWGEKLSWGSLERGVLPRECIKRGALLNGGVQGVWLHVPEGICGASYCDGPYNGCFKQKH